VTSPQHLLDSVVAIAAAYLFTLPLGWERKARSATHVGLRTLPLVAVGTCAYLLLARYLREAGVFDADGLARSLRAVMTGIGFIGGGAILEDARNVRGVGGVATAASVWTTGAIGISVAVGHYAVALVLAVVTLLVLEIPRWREGARDGPSAAPPSAPSA
jgi:putative Mg2+ transporter-C (MgtC) family protein